MKKKPIKEPEKTEEEKIAPEVVQALLQQGIDFDITVNNPGILHRLKLIPKIRKFKIYPACPGMLLYISKIILTIEKFGELENDEISYEEGLKNIVANKDKILEILSLAILNRKISNPYWLFKKWQIRKYLEWNTSANELSQLTQLVLMQMGVTNFLACTALIKRMNLIGAEKTKQPSSTGGK